MSFFNESENGAMGGTPSSSSREGRLAERAPKGGEVAVIGLACRFPGASDPETFWRKLCEGHVEIQTIPEDRWDWRKHYGDTQRDPNRARVAKGAFIEDIFAFDAAFFSLSPRESALMDPQQRHLLETVWRAVEDAGYRMGDLSERYRVGVFVGLSSFDYVSNYTLSGEDFAMQATTGMAHSIAANRISHLFNFHGPSETVDTACSSALVALHRARTAIANGECDCAIVGGANAILNPISHIGFAKAGMLSEEGVCRTFDERADGFVRGEGCGVVLLKSLAKARQDGDDIYGVIRGTAVNHCGRSRTLTSPNAFSQSAVIQAAQECAGVTADTVSYVEAHGTGTPKGDPAEVLGLKRAFSRNRSTQEGGACGLGTVKTNIGHLESAAGMAGLIKVLLSLRHRTLPGLASFERLNPLIELEGSPFYLVTETQPWERPVLEGETWPLRAGVSGFGFGGTNAHAVLEEHLAEPRPASSSPEGEAAPCVLPLSAPTREGLRERVRQLIDHLPSPALAGTFADVAFTLQIGRESFSERVAVVARDVAGAVAQLARYLAHEGGAGPGVWMADGEGGTEPGRGDDAWQAVHEWVAGQAPAWWDPAHPLATAGRRIALPTYCFARTQHAFQRRGDGATRARLHRLIDENVSTFHAQRFRKRFETQDRLLSDHRVREAGTLAEAALLDMMYQAAVLSLGPGHVLGLDEVNWLAPLTLSEAKDVFIDLSPTPEGVVCTVSGAPDEALKQVYARALVRVAEATPMPDVQAIDVAGLFARLAPQAPALCVERAAAAGRVLGATYQSLEMLAASSDEVVARLRVPDIERAEAPGQALPSSLVQGAFTVLAALDPEVFGSGAPGWMAGLRILGPLPEECVVHAAKSAASQGGIDLLIADGQGRVMVSMSGLRMQPSVAAQAMQDDKTPGDDGASASASASAAVSGETSAALDEQVRAFLLEVIASATKLPLEQVDALQTFDRFGFDSTLAMEVTDAIEKACGPLPKTLFFEYTTVHELAEHLLQRYKAPLQRFFAQPGRAIAVAKASSASEAEFGAAQRPHRFAALAADSASRLDGRALAADEPIAIIGIGGRYPSAPTLQDFWRNLASGLDLIVTVPGDRWNMDNYFDPQKGKVGKTYCKWGSFIDDAMRFDATVFNISPLEARVLDPQERQFLEIAWSTIEDAGYTKAALAKKPMGVFVGAMWAHYQMIEPGEDCEWFPNASFASIANRVSYFFDLNGPSVAVDTMCASSLSSIHMACRSLRQGECEVALAGGVNLTLHVNKYLQLSQSRFMASHGRCKSFGEGGDGFVPGEGVGAVLLKPLSKALADGDFIHAIVRGSATNHGGKTNGYTMPNPRAQSAVVQSALTNAGVTPDQIQYIEAHGTGTALGDPIEIAGLDEVFQAGVDRGGPRILVGSVKSNMGHLESAAGIAGITKVILQMRYGKIAPSIHSTRLNPAIDFKKTRFTVPQTLTEWPRQTAGDGQAGLRRAGVSSFGAGGVNVHIVLEEFDPARRVRRDRQRIDQWVAEHGVWITLSAPKPEQLERTMARLSTFLDSGGDWARLRDEHDLSLLDLAWTLQCGREEMAHRFITYVSSEAQLLKTLKAVAMGETVAGHVWQGKAAGRILQQPAQEVAACDWEQAVARAQAWTSGAAAAPSSAMPPDTPLRRVPLPTLSFMGARHWIGNMPQPTSTVRPQEHALFRNLTVLNTTSN